MPIKKANLKAGPESKEDLTQRRKDAKAAKVFKDGISVFASLSVLLVD